MVMDRGELVRKPEILRRLTTRLGIEPGAFPKDRWLAQEIIPVTIVDELLKVSKGDRSTGLDLSGSAGSAVTAFTVPQGKRWSVWFMRTSATIANSTLFINDGTNSFIFTVPATAVVMSFEIMKLEEGWILGRTATGNGGDSNETLDILYDEEDAY